MFDIPDAKRIRRADLYPTLSFPEPSEPDPALAALFQSQLSQLYGPITNDLTPSLPLESKPHSNVQAPLHITATDLSASGTQDEGFEFPLFSRATSSLSKDKEKTLTRIRLDDDADPSTHGKGAFITPLRHLGYYFTSLDPDWGRRRRRFEAVALSGEDVKDYLRVRYKGWEVPWRVTALKTVEMMKLGTRGKTGNGLKDEDFGSNVPESTAHTEPIAPTHPESFPDLDPTHQPTQKSPDSIPLSSHSSQIKPKTKTKTKPNKKRRIILRKRQKLEDEAIKRKGEEHERMVKREREREEMVREKRLRKNRERKVKRLRKKEEERGRKKMGEEEEGEGKGEGKGISKGISKGI